MSQIEIQLREQLKEALKIAERGVELLEELQTQNKILSEALMFYAEYDNWGDSYDSNAIIRDNGEKATIALREITKDEEAEVSKSNISGKMDTGS